MDNTDEIRWHGRGGQGAKTAALLFGDAAMSLGKYIQAFPEYGPERMGAPVATFNRISEFPITSYYGISSPDIVLVLDETLLGKVDTAAGLKEDGIFIVNTAKSPKEIRKEISITGRKIYTIDASKISHETIGKDIPNTPMLGALSQVSKLLDVHSVIKDLEKKLTIKFASKPEVIKGNIDAIKRA